MSYDLIIIGAGPGGYVCAIRAAQLGLKTAIVEKNKTLGGTCANIGCIPSKALLHATELFHEAGHGFAAFGIDIPAPKLNLAAMMKHKADTVAANVGGVAMLMKKNKVDVHTGTGTIIAAGKVEVASEDGKKTTLETKSIVIATGSEAAQLRGGDGHPIAFDEKIIVSSTGALELDKVPSHLVVVGAGVIGLELGSVWKRLGAKVTAIEFTDKCLGTTDTEVARQFQRLMEKQGVTFHMSSKVTKVEKAGKGAKVTFEPVAGGAATALECDVVLIATGRVPNTSGLGLEKIGVAMERGRVTINDHFETSVSGIYRHRRRGARRHARPQGGRGRCRHCRAPGRSSRTCELRLYPRRGLHLPRGRHDRQERGRAQGRWHRLQGRQVPVHGQRPGARQSDHRRFRQGAGGCDN